MKVANRKTIRRLSFRSMRASGVRNTVAVAAIALTTVLFTALMTIAMSLVENFQMSNFRQAGGYAHGTFKFLTKEQVDALKDDKLIKEYGLKIPVGVAYDEPFNKDHVELNYFDENDAKWYFMNFVEGGLPAENTNGAAVDTKVLEMLGVEKKLGEEFDMTFEVDGKPITKTFTLSGWWEYDPVIPARQLAMAKSYADEIFEELDTQGADGMTMTYCMDVMFANSGSIEKNMKEVLERHGYKADDDSGQYDSGATYIKIGVNWGYVGVQLSDSFDLMTAAAFVAAIALIVFTGYLIIYNVFQISVSNDIRSYGLLKTIGTTGRQIKRMVRIQAMALSCIGIPIGLALGWCVGALLMPIVLLQVSKGISSGELSVSPWIFVGSAIFSMVTVLISCKKPCKMASRVSPIEALRYTEADGIKKKKRTAKKGASILRMAFANLGRNRKKTIVTVVSLSLAVVILEITVIFTDGFDMNKYLRQMAVDFQVADASYFNVAVGFRDLSKGVTQDVIDEISANGGITDGGCTYAAYGVNALKTKEQYKNSYWLNINAKYADNPEQYIEYMINQNMRENGLIIDEVQAIGMDSFCLGKLDVVAGDVSKLNGEGNYIAAAYHTDDYGNINYTTNSFRLGDKVTVRYVEESELYNPRTGEVYASYDEIGDKGFAERETKYHDVEYEVAAEVVIKEKMSYRYFSADRLIFGSENIMKNTDNTGVMYYAFDTTDEARADMEEFISDYTQNVNTAYDYESKKSYEDEFNSFRQSFRLLGGALSFIVGLVGILNFLNAILTGIASRRREFAVLQSVGMTGGQLNRMLVFEGLAYALGAVVFSLALSLALGPFIGSAFADMFWFFTYRFTVTPIFVIAPLFAALGIAVPLIVHRITAKKSIVERLREAEF